MAQLISDKALHEWRKDRAAPTLDMSATLPRLPPIGGVLESKAGGPAYVEANDHGGFAGLCVPIGEPAVWELCCGRVPGALRAIIAEKDTPKFKESPSLKFYKAKVIGHAKNGRAVFVSVILPDPQTE